MESMECDRLREVLFDHVDGLLGRDEAEAARNHLAACGPCRALQEEVRRNFSALDSWEEEDLPAGAIGRLEARIAGSPRSAAPAPAPRRSWIRLAVPYAAGLATASAFLWVFVLPHGFPVPVPLVGSPSPAPASPSVVREGSDLVTPAPASLFSGAAGSTVAGGPSLRPGERPLEFRDADRGVLRTFLLPPGVDPGKVLLVDTPPRILPDDEGVR